MMLCAKHTSPRTDLLSHFLTYEAFCHPSNLLPGLYLYVSQLILVWVCLLPDQCCMVGVTESSSSENRGLASIVKSQQLYRVAHTHKHKEIIAFLFYILFERDIFSLQWMELFGIRKVMFFRAFKYFLIPHLALFIPCPHSYDNISLICRKKRV